MIQTPLSYEPMAYLPDMEQIDSDLRDKVHRQMASFSPNEYTVQQVQQALLHPQCSISDFQALLSPAAELLLEQLAARAAQERARHFGNSVALFTPLYLSNYCENHCVYCGFHCRSGIRRTRLHGEMLVQEMQAIAQSGIEEILLLTGESRTQSSVQYIGEACTLARHYFRSVGLEVYPMNTAEYRYLHECGADYVTVFQETYDIRRYKQVHLAGHKCVWPYRFEAQERALKAGMRGVTCAALFGLSDFRADAFAAALHIYYLQRKYPWAEFSLSCPRLRPTGAALPFQPQPITERQLCQVLCAFRIFLPYVGITVSSRESARFRNGILPIAATKASAGVSTAVGKHQAVPHSSSSQTSDSQFEIADRRSLHQMYAEISAIGLQPVLNDYLDV